MDDFTLNSKILAVDDSIFVLSVIQRILDDRYDVHTVQSANAAYDVLEEFTPDLILLDLEMPKINGYEMLEQLKNNPEWNSIPVIFLTGMSDRESEEKALSMGAVDYILKPISSGVLKKRIQMHLELNMYQKKLEKLVDIKTNELLETQEILRKAVVDAEAASRAKSDFLANISHEIRTPMNGIVGFSELALGDDISPKTKDYLLKIKSSSKALLQIINDILDISKIESGKIELNSIPFDMQEVFDICRTIILPNALEKGITLCCLPEPYAGKKLLGDPSRLRQTLLNLLSNAVKFTHTGTIELLSEIRNITDDSVTVRFEVKDSGIGMTPEQVDEIFNPFYQADSTKTRQFGGVGLGLPITKNIVELMGGRLTVESASGEGSRFSFELTFKTADVPCTASEVGCGLENPVFEGEVLLCEDNAINQEIVCEHLEMVGLKTVVAANGRIGVDIVRERMKTGRPFDIIFMDIQMPVMDGLEATKELAEIGNKTPIIPLTANVMASDKETYLKYGMQGCLSKPLQKNELWDCLLKYLTPVRMENVDQDEQRAADDKSFNRLLTNFARSNQSAFRDVRAAVDAGDIALAHRLVHTLKGLAGLMGKTELQEAARAVEYSLRDGKAGSAEQMDRLERALNGTLAELAPLLEVPVPQASGAKLLDKAKAAEVFAKLEPLLGSDDANSLKFMDELTEIPETDILIQQIENYDFEMAAVTLANVRRALNMTGSIYYEA